MAVCSVRHVVEIGDEHRQCGLDALADFGIFRDDRDDVVGRDLEKGLWHERRLLALGEKARQRVVVVRHEHAAARDRGDFDERTAIEEDLVHLSSYWRVDVEACTACAGLGIDAAL